MRHYEIMYILVSTLDEKGIKTARFNLEKILTDNGAKITGEKVWGLKKFAYEIDHQKQGYYVVIDVECEPKAIHEFNRLVKINNARIRHMIINLDKEKIKIKE